MNQSLEAVILAVDLPAETRLEDYQALYTQERKARGRAETEAYLLRQRLKTVFRIAERVFSPYLTVKERLEAFRQLAKWRENTWCRFLI